MSIFTVVALLAIFAFLVVAAIKMPFFILFLFLYVAMTVLYYKRKAKKS